ncbi:MAG: hypothetical protein M3468_06320 [Acidobacteriota bacterium]|nr:hypothetical protein [Acidobacteriota bacterium]
MDDDKITSGILGLGGAAVPKTPGDPSTEFDAESVAQRRARMHQGEADADAARDEGDQSGPGATGIDMGSAGDGTDLSGK